MRIGDVRAEYLAGRKSRDPVAVPLRLRSVTTTRGSCVVPPGTSTLRNEVSTVLNELCEIVTNAVFWRRAFTASGEVFTTKVAGMSAASVAAAAKFVAPPMFISARARPSRARRSVVVSLAVVAAAVALVKRVTASAQIAGGWISGPRLIAALHMLSPSRVRLYPA